MHTSTWLHDARRARARQAVRRAALAHGLLLPVVVMMGDRGALPVRAAACLLFGLALCWGANTVAHIHLHTPLGRGPRADAAISLYLTLLLGIPQQHWLRRHFAHHALALPPHRTRPAHAALEIAALVAMLATLGVAAPTALFGVWLPGTLLGFALCALQGHGEHAGADAGVDHHAAFYNWLWFNDGYHAAHHRHPERPFTELPDHARPDDAHSPLPPLLRWLPRGFAGLAFVARLPGAIAALPAIALDASERLVLRVPALQRLLLATHAPALRAVLAAVRPDRVAHIVVVGGGLFPRSALLLARLLPHARLTLVDSAPAHLAQAAAFLPADLHARVTLLSATFDPTAPPTKELTCDLLVIPLALRGLRSAIYHRPPASFVLVHDWIWRRRGAASARVAWYLGKRINLLTTTPAKSPAARNTATLPAGSACCPSSSSSVLPAATVTPS